MYDCILATIVCLYISAYLLYGKLFIRLHPNLTSLLKRFLLDKSNLTNGSEQHDVGRKRVSHHLIHLIEDLLIVQWARRHCDLVILLNDDA